MRASNQRATAFCSRPPLLLRTRATGAATIKRSTRLTRVCFAGLHWNLERDTAESYENKQKHFVKNIGKKIIDLFRSSQLAHDPHNIVICVVL